LKQHHQSIIVTTTTTLCGCTRVHVSVEKLLLFLKSKGLFEFALNSSRHKLRDFGTTLIIIIVVVGKDRNDDDFVCDGFCSDQQASREHQRDPGRVFPTTPSSRWRGVDVVVASARDATTIR
jgi:hypothetical protein